MDANDPIPYKFEVERETSGMQQTIEVMARRTSADAVFDYLNEQICSLELMPGTKISEAEIAAKFGISRQPVRDAFSRLGNMGLLLIRPQKATEVSKFSMRAISAARFIRLSIEVEVLRKAAERWDGTLDDELSANLQAQTSAVKANDSEAFQGIDYAFHQLLCRAGDAEFAFEMIQEKKARIDRLCALSLSNEFGMADLVKDHSDIFEKLRQNDVDGATRTMRAHLSRLEQTIDLILENNAHFFEAE